ncbi:hypothetical protein PPERSA_07825 [Pseudocohnilembus persalinus]|uniref:Timeless C-terminal domain-containing protein n=1 Tax=Pseudocohnilembus persalinus TaxID=266149 RepID=A0A0V0QCG6_PSEPJ|nr:hypothetical protein PPERSA_07825 [Pseudocohnilembus persalinus]|eukprot:KRW99748.1 hypothetical protein PPERSA_07825 [Pseudocohnilembus persalinus]
MTLQQSIRSLRRNKNKLGDIQQNDIQEYLTVIFTNYIDFLKTYPPDQIQGGNNQKDLGLGADFAIVPIFKIQFELFENEYFLQILDTLDIRPPTQGEWLWRIPTFIREVDAQLYIEKIKKYFEEEIDMEEKIKNQTKLNNIKQLNQNNNNSLQNYDSGVNIDGEGAYINQQEKMLEELENTQINKIRKMNQRKKMEEELEIQKLDKIYNKEHDDDEKFEEFKESQPNSQQIKHKNQEKQFKSQQNSQKQEVDSQKQSQFIQTQQQEIDQMFSSNENSRQL